MLPSFAYLNLMSHQQMPLSMMGAAGTSKKQGGWGNRGAAGKASQQDKVQIGSFWFRVHHQVLLIYINYQKIKAYSPDRTAGGARGVGGVHICKGIGAGSRGSRGSCSLPRPLARAGQGVPPGCRGCSLAPHIPAWRCQSWLPVPFLLAHRGLPCMPSSTS